jgi:hypothetical protein
MTRQRLQRSSWSVTRRPDHPRLLIEKDDAALALSDFSVFTEAGFQVAYCTGPCDDRHQCPMLRGEDCDLVSGADVVLNGLGSDDVAEAIVRRHPCLPVVVESRRGPDGALQAVPEGCIPLVYPAPVDGQAHALQRVAYRGATTPE